MTLVGLFSSFYQTNPQYTSFADAAYSNAGLSAPLHFCQRSIIYVYVSVIPGWERGVKLYPLESETESLLQVLKSDLCGFALGVIKQFSNAALRCVIVVIGFVNSSSVIQQMYRVVEWLRSRRPLCRLRNCFNYPDIPLCLHAHRNGSDLGSVVYGR